jgi:asparagine synthase (glutamine-hydrolysing)
LAVIAGRWQRSSGQIRGGVIADLLGSFHAPFHGVLSAFDDERIAFAARSLGRPAIVSHRGIVAALSGRLDDGLHVEDVLDAYEDEGSGGLRNLTGDYAIAIYDPHHQIVMLLRDAVGTQPLYYYASGEVFVFGSQIKAVLAGCGIPARPNHAALSQLLITGEGTPRGETCYAGVQAVPPGFALSVTSEICSSSSHVDLRPIVPSPLRTFEESTAAFKRALCASVHRRIACEGNTAVLVSGGIDSAALLAVAARQSDRDRIVAISYGLADGSSADERQYVNAVVSSAGVRSVYFDLTPTGFPDQVDADVFAGESPLVDDVPATLRRAAAAARAYDAQHLMIGTWGDQVLFPFPPPYLLELLRGGNLSVYRKIARTLGDWMTDVPKAELRRALIGQAVRGLVPATLLNRIRPVSRHASSTFDVLARMATPRRRTPVTHAAAVRREVTSPVSVDAMEGTTKWGWSQGLEAQLPFLDADLVQLLFAIPAEHALHDGVPKALLRSAMADQVPDLVLERRDKGDYSEVIRTCFNEVRDGCMDRLECGTRLVRHGLMSRDSADRTLARLRAPGEIDTGLLSTMVGLDAWLKVFFEDSMGRHV